MAEIERDVAAAPATSSQCAGRTNGPSSRLSPLISQSADPDSPHFSDMTRVFSDQGWVAFPYRMRDIKKDQIDSISPFEKR